MTVAVPDELRIGVIDALRAADARFALLHHSRVARHPTDPTPAYRH